MTAKQNRWMLLVILLLGAGAAFVVFFPKIRLYYGLDIQGGLRVVLRAKTEEYEKREKKRWEPSNLELVRHIIENRVNATGVSEPVLVTRPPDQIVVELPGVKDPESVKERIQTTASLEFYMLPQLGSKDGSSPTTWRLSEDPQTKKEILVHADTGTPLTKDELELNIFERDPILTGKDMLPKCQAVPSPGTGQPVIEFEFNNEGARIFEETTRANVGKRLAIFLDKQLLTAPVINGPIAGRGIIEGNFTLVTAKALADQLNAGALPVPLELLETRKLEATLGKEAVDKTTKAGLIGLAFVVVFMLAIYRLPGLIANGALLLYTIFSIAAFKLMEMTLTLPGIAGFILSIGMAVDANILIFERVKEELKSGKTLRAGIDAGFKRAFTAIFDSNVCTLLTCYVLYTFGTGPIRGFAVTLALGVAISMFTAITVTRTFLFGLVSFGNSLSPAMFGLNDKPARHLHVMRHKGLWIGISVAVIVPGVLALLAGGLKPSIDFRGGTELQVPFAQRHNSDQIKSALLSINKDFEDSRVVVSDNTAFVVTRRLDNVRREQVISTLTSKVGPLQANTSVAYADVSGTISAELTRNAIWAVVFASILIVLYLAFRFSMSGFSEGLKYGLCAVIALLHDVLVVLGAFAILGKLLDWQVDSLFVTAMLTVIGFSVHDTIIVFDRIRENLQHRLKGETFSDLTDRSIDQTFTRSIYTSLTVVLTLAALFFFGGASVHQFTGALLIGIISGTYSSIFNASVLLVYWKRNDTFAPSAPVGGVKRTAPSRPEAREAGDRALVTPPSEQNGRAVETPTANGDVPRSAPGPRPEGGAPRVTPRRQPVRRRRM